MPEFSRKRENVARLMNLPPKRARLNCIAHLLRQIPYKDLRPVELDLPARQPDTGYKRPKKSSQGWIPRIY